MINSARDLHIRKCGAFTSTTNKHSRSGLMQRPWKTFLCVYYYSLFSFFFHRVQAKYKIRIAYVAFYTFPSAMRQNFVTYIPTGVGQR